MKVQLGGGTDIARPSAYGARAHRQPAPRDRRVITDFYEGGNAAHLVRTVQGLRRAGHPRAGPGGAGRGGQPGLRPRAGASASPNAGAHVGAMTPGELAEFVAEKLR